MRFFIFTICFIPLIAFTQVRQHTIEANYFYGSFLPHNKNILHLITGMPEGVQLSYNKKTFGTQAWQTLYNYPDYGVSFQYQNNKNEILGNLYGLYAHMNFYFLKRNLQFRVAQGIAYSTYPFNKNTNYLNVAYGARVMPSTYFSLSYSKPNIFKNVGAQIGVNFVHHSNANTKAPNTSTNTLALAVGLNYTFTNNQPVNYIEYDKPSFSKKIKYNLFFRTGFNESDVPNSGTKPFYVASFYAAKQVSPKSVFQLGADMFWMRYLKELIVYEATVFPELGLDPNKDYKRVGVFLGYEMLIAKLSLDIQAGAYVYNPSKKQGDIYQRIGLRYHISPKFSGGISLKTHLAQAEALEFSLGYQL
ncbi:acyloxyacyl hydrolase [Flavobacterium agricola]|uniref:Acyloxyacyl hydrolase n=1 Tax=Flavobacterium agricola TaxID=2870839 RepID=A0ABY6LYF4_9FLAO|nr:acyloxyacyl hydrolase [Flavobacterium agricola]UYW01369.1 acyloxyacyl hydrolase [Flavobacterium agricola]